ncbi:hypothetical protein GCM10010277_59410 [Streptomyces longisporoflavus]|nr:hypothetical protein GCM10010277_59410 [Streptomyces longisporoflavus]
MTGRARRLLAGALAAGVLAPALLTGCAQSVDPIERLGRKAAEKVPPRKPAPSPGCGQGAGNTAAPSAAAPETGRGPAAGEERGPAAGKEPTPPEMRCPEGRRGAPEPPRSSPSP